MSRGISRFLCLDETEDEHVIRSPIKKGIKYQECDLCPASNGELLKQRSKPRFNVIHLLPGHGMHRRGRGKQGDLLGSYFNAWADIIKV